MSQNFVMRKVKAERNNVILGKLDGKLVCLPKDDHNSNIAVFVIPQAAKPAGLL